MWVEFQSADDLYGGELLQSVQNLKSKCRLRQLKVKTVECKQSDRRRAPEIEVKIKWIRQLFPQSHPMYPWIHSVVWIRIVLLTMGNRENLLILRIHLRKV